MASTERYGDDVRRIVFRTFASCRDLPERERMALRFRFLLNMKYSEFCGILPRGDACGTSGVTPARARTITMSAIGRIAERIVKEG